MREKVLDLVMISMFHLLLILLLLRGSWSLRGRGWIAENLWLRFCLAWYCDLSFFNSSFSTCMLFAGVYLNCRVLAFTTVFLMLPEMFLVSSVMWLDSLSAIVMSLFSLLIRYHQRMILSSFIYICFCYAVLTYPASSYLLRLIIAIKRMASASHSSIPQSLRSSNSVLNSSQVNAPLA